MNPVGFHRILYLPWAPEFSVSCWYHPGNYDFLAVARRHNQIIFDRYARCFNCSDASSHLNKIKQGNRTILRCDRCVIEAKRLLRKRQKEERLAAVKEVERKRRLRENQRQHDEAIRKETKRRTELRKAVQADVASWRIKTKEKEEARRIAAAARRARLAERKKAREKLIRELRDDNEARIRRQVKAAVERAREKARFYRTTFEPGGQYRIKSVMAVMERIPTEPPCRVVSLRDTDAAMDEYQAGRPARLDPANATLLAMRQPGYGRWLDFDSNDMRDENDVARPIKRYSPPKPDTTPGDFCPRCRDHGFFSWVDDNTQCDVCAWHNKKQKPEGGQQCAPLKKSASG